MPAPARMLVLPGAPSSHRRIPSEALGAHAIPARGPKFFHEVGASVEGMPLSPGNTHPRGAPGNWVDCCPGTMVSILFCVSYQGMLTSQRNPRLIVKFGLRRQ